MYSTSPCLIMDEEFVLFSRPVHFLLPPKELCPSNYPLNCFLSSGKFPLAYKFAETWPAFKKKCKEKVHLPITPFPIPSITPFFLFLFTIKHLEKGACIHCLCFFLFPLKYVLLQTLINHSMKIALFRFTSDLHITKPNNYYFLLFCCSQGL